MDAGCGDTGSTGASFFFNTNYDYYHQVPLASVCFNGKRLLITWLQLERSKLNRD